MRLTPIKLLVSLFYLIANQSISQEFYPLNFPQLITDEGIDQEQLAELNSSYLSRKGFESVTDSLYINPRSKEKVMLSSKKVGDLLQVEIRYFTNGKHLGKFKNRLKDKELGLSQINENLYDQNSGNFKTRIEIAEDLVVEDQKFDLIKVSFIYRKNESSRKYIFPLQNNYPFQNTSWNFDISYKKSDNYSDRNEIKIKLTKENSTNRIEFIDDLNYVITFTDKNKKVQKLKGTYRNYLGLDFKTDYEKKVKKAQPKNGIPSVPELEHVPFHYIEVAEINQVKNMRKYFEFFFNHSFDFTDYGDAIYLEKTLFDPMNLPTTAPVVPIRNE